MRTRCWLCRPRLPLQPERLLANTATAAPATLGAAQMKYLAAVLQESMRLYPVVSSGTARITSAPMRLGGYDLPAGQPVLIPFFAIHRSPALWPEPDAFQPERWLAGKQEQAPLGAADDGAEQSDGARQQAARQHQNGGALR